MQRKMQNFPVYDKRKGLRVNPAAVFSHHTLDPVAELLDAR
jgi:hypothetical protein